MKDGQIAKLVEQGLGAGGGILRLAPAWVPRSFMMPGRRLKLHPDDIYALGAQRGGINERWFSSTTNADNGPGTPEDEGLSYVDVEGERCLLKDAVGLLGDRLLGADVMAKHDGWGLLCKFFDNLGPIPHHLHQDDAHAALVGRRGKPEAYYFPPQLNVIENIFPHTYFGLEPGTTKDQVVDCLQRWDEGDNGILRLSKAYKLTPGTGWDVAPGILHAPGSLVTYEPQRASDVFGMYQSLVDGRPVPRELLTKDMPEDKWYDWDFLVGTIDWDANVDPEFGKHHFCPPKPKQSDQETKSLGYVEKDVVYGTEHYSAKELTVLPGRTVTVTDDWAHGFIMMQGHGSLNSLPVETPALIRFGQMTWDEGFVSVEAARAGVTVANHSAVDPLVMLKHFGPAV